MQDERIIGIDLGTTNSVVAVIEGDEPVVIPNQEGANKTPSVVAFLDNDECIVGEIARRQAATNPQRTVSSIKRLIGQDFEDVEDRLGSFAYDVVNHDDRVLVDIGGLGYSPEQISALIIKKLKESAESYLGCEVNKAVITVPANFNDSQRTATLEAARVSGLEVLRLLNEPTAAALAYGLGRASAAEEVIAVFDFGGGTFDISVLEITGKTFEVLTSTGDSDLGGDDLDEAIVALIVEEFEEEHGVDLTEDPVTLKRLKEVAEKAKCELSTTSSTTITLPFIAYRSGQPLHLERQLTRDEFEQLIEPFVNRSITACKDALSDANIAKGDIDKVILVGGSTRIPLVQDAVEDFFGLQPFKGINPDEVVALGAATQAGVFAGNIEEVTLLEVSPHSLGIEVKDGKFSRIIEKNATIPIKAAKNFTTTEDNQTFVNIHVLQGESEEATENRSLGKFLLTDIPAQPRGRARIRVTFFVNADGVMEISSEDLASGIAKTLTIVHSELDEQEKKTRKRARARAKRTGKPGKGAGKKYSASSQSQPKSLRGRRKKNDSTVEPTTKDADSSGVTSISKDENFAVLGDTSPGTSPTIAVPAQHASSDAVPLKHNTAPEEPAQVPGNTDVFKAPTRYGRTSVLRPQGLDGQTPEPVPEPAPPHDGERLTDSQIFLPPVITPPGKTKEDTQNIQLEPEDTAEFSSPPVAEEEVDWPGLIDSAIDMAEAGDRSGEATEIYDKAAQMLGQEPWITDSRFQVVRARILLTSFSGKEKETTDLLRKATERYAQQRPKELVDLFERVLTNASEPAALRRERARLRERVGELEGATDDLEAATRLDPIESDGAELERLYNLRIERKDDSAAKFKLVKIFLKTDRVDDAIDILQDLQKQQAYETRALKILGLCHWQKNLHFLAWQKFKQLTPNEEIADILYRLATDMEGTGQLNNALTVYEHLDHHEENYRDVPAKVKKLKYRIKMQQEEADQSKAALISDTRFTIIEEINRGSMGIIYKARDKILEEVVALKVLNEYLCSDPSAVERFKREARAAKKLSHPYIVRIHDMYENGDKRFISMEYIEGTDLKRQLSEHTHFNEEQLTFYFLQICDALSYAHKLNIIHRDIKPANIMITKQNNVKVTDFGIAKMLKGDDSTKSGTAIIGTPLYMAPEQITGEGVDARTDIYSLGIMMYELCSGHPPFYLGNIEYHHIHTPPPVLPDKVSPRLQEIIMKCVEKSAENRFQSVDDVFSALQS